MDVWTTLSHQLASLFLKTALSVVILNIMEQDLKCTKYLVLSSLEVLFFSFAGYQGGAIAVESCDNVFIAGGIIQDNQAVLSGGGMYVTDANIHIYSCYFFDNSVHIDGTSNTHGGALYVSFANITIDSCYFDKNNVYASGSRSSGGGVYVTNSDINIDNCFFRDNHIIVYEQTYLSFVYGGALNAIYSYINVSNTQFTDNVVDRSAFNTYCGAVCVTECKLASFNNSTFTGNIATFGGALAAHRSHINVSSSEF